MKFKNLTIFKNRNFLNNSFLNTSCLVNNNFSVKNCLLFSTQHNKQQQQQQENKYNYENDFNKKQSFSKYALIGVFGGLSLYANFKYRNKLYALNDEKEEKVEPGKVRNDLPTYTLTQVQQHNSTEKGIWVIYKNGVYDITQFIEAHPGGSEKISMAAGQSIEPFWRIYNVHHKNEVYEILEELRIGNLNQADVDRQNKINKSTNENDPFQNEPERHPLLKVVSQKPFNAETPTQLSADNIITPNELHFKRNHLPVPKIDIKNFKLEILNGLSGKTKSLTLNDLKTKFKTYTIPVTIQCAGNRRKAMHDYKPVQGLMWTTNAISTAEWSGVKLKDLLEYCGVDLKNEGIKHIHFVGLDHDPTGNEYGASIPKEKVLNDFGDVLIAFQMNGEDIPLDHGFPLRAVVPGVIGARSVKWLQKIVLSNDESKSHWQQKDYKLLSPTISNLSEADFSKLKPIQECPVQSAICEPLDGSVIKRENGTFKVKGYAYSGGGNSIESVLVSLDDGQTWKQANLIKRDQPLYRAWAWTLWELEVDIPADKNNLKIMCVATDSNENTQPETVKSLWNLRGLLNNSWHSVNVKFK